MCSRPSVKKSFKMPGIVSPPNSNDHEERRNILLRARYGTHLQQIRETSKGKLHVVGQSAVKSVRTPAAGHIPVSNRLVAQGQHQVLIKKGKKRDRQNESIAPNQKRYDNDPIVMKEKYLSESPVEMLAKVPPSSPQNFSPQAEPTKFLEGGEKTRFSTTLRAKDKQATTGASASVSAGDIGGETDGNITPKEPNVDLSKPDELNHCNSHTEVHIRSREVKAKSSINEIENRAGVDSLPRDNRDRNSSKTSTRRSLDGTTGSKQTLRERNTNRGGHGKTAQDQSQTKRLSHDEGQLENKSSSAIHLGRRRSSLMRKAKSKETIKILQTKESFRDDKGATPSKDELQDLEVKTVRKFLEMPKSKPKHVCFDFPGVDLTYVDVKQAIEEVIPHAFETNKVISVQFENVNVKLGTASRDNRWHIELCDFTTRNKLIKAGLSFKRPKTRHSDNICPETSQRTLSPRNRQFPRQQPRVEIKLYDMVIMEEYKLFLRRTAAEEKLQNVKLLCAGRAHDLLSAML
ncbi:uncharacterized protein LOC143473184 isoform X2 [Clavelina lepadiformis]|uniref:uncharacterized protein LOC143473184 isoform X2 n=1 Tax=Clavelina lepadiformis TaxID=159417 RepID=UPI004042F016